MKSDEYKYSNSRWELRGQVVKIGTAVNVCLLTLPRKVSKPANDDSLRMFEE